MLFRIAYTFMRWLLTLVVTALGGVRVEGRERLPETGGVILAANHVSYLDPLLMGLVAAPRLLWYMAKAPLFRLPVIGAVMRFFRSFPVRPDAADREALRKSGEILAAGEALLIFPEGSCSRDGELLPFRQGLAMIALRSQAPVVPVAILGTEQALPPDAYWPHRVPGGLIVRFGPPIHPSELSPDLERKEQMELLTERVEEAIRELLGRHEVAANGKELSIHR